MRTLQEKYNGVLEGNFSKAQFRRDAAIEMPQFVSTLNSFDDTVTILKNKGVIAEAKKQEPKYSTAKPEDHIAPDVLDTGIKFELDKKHGTLDVSEEEYEKARAAAIKNLAKDVLYYIKQDSIQLDTPGEKMEKAKVVKEEISKEEAWKKFQEERHVTDKTIKVAREDFEKEWEAGKLKEGFLDRFKKKPAQSEPAPAKVLSADEIQDMIDQEAKTNTVGDILNAATVLGTIDLRNATPEQVKMFVSIARDSDYGHDTITGDTYMDYLESLPNYKGVDEVKVQVNIPGQDPRFAEDDKEYSDEEADEFIQRAKDHGATPMNTTFKKVHETVDRSSAIAAVRTALKGKYEKLEDRDIAEFLQVHLNDFMGEDPDVDINDREAIVDNFESYIYHNEDSGDIQDMAQRIGFFPNEESPEKYANDNVGSPMHAPPGLEEGEVVDLPMTAAGYSRGETYDTEKYGKVKIIDQLDGDDIPAAYGRFRVEKINEEDKDKVPASAYPENRHTLTPDELEEKKALKEMFKKIIVNLINE